MKREYVYLRVGDLVTTHDGKVGIVIEDDKSKWRPCYVQVRRTTEWAAMHWLWYSRQGKYLPDKQPSPNDIMVVNGALIEGAPDEQPNHLLGVVAAIAAAMAILLGGAAWLST